MFERRTPISPDLMEVLIRQAHEERAATLAAMMKRIPVLAGAAFQSLFSPAVQRIHPVPTSHLS